ncbi:hypothetical protein KOW79_019264 [Hemibagrus wyckioides]|uniref:Urotensin-2 receptor n=1 Tax=Hemibagrus wyckioides TaxID=337641 RepID=A0A9D3N6F9_9TELE|nr:hypothetical protein KOW79_019264 [Hemibagrus wyckioides]
MGTRVNDSAVFVNASLPFSETPASSQDTVITFLLGTVLAMMFLVGTAGNVYTLVVMNIAIRVTGTMYVYIVNLALADLLYLCTIPFVVCTYFAKDWYFGDIGCRVIFSLDFLTMHASIFMLTVMSTERYVAVLRPLDTFTRSSHYRRSVTCAVWLISFALSLPTMIMIELRTSLQDGVEKRICHPTWQMTAYKAYLTVLFNTCILAPGCVIGFLYLKLARTYWTSQTTVFSSSRTKCPKQKDSDIYSSLHFSRGPLSNNNYISQHALLTSRRRVVRVTSFFACFGRLFPISGSKAQKRVMPL